MSSIPSVPALESDWYQPKEGPAVRKLDNSNYGQFASTCSLLLASNRAWNITQGTEAAPAPGAANRAAIEDYDKRKIYAVKAILASIKGQHNALVKPSVL